MILKGVLQSKRGKEQERKCLVHRSELVEIDQPVCVPGYNILNSELPEEKQKRLSGLQNVAQGYRIRNVQDAGATINDVIELCIDRDAYSFQPQKILFEWRKTIYGRLGKEAMPDVEESKDWDGKKNGV